MMEFETPSPQPGNLAGSGLDGSPFVFSETDSGGLVAIALFSYFASVRSLLVKISIYRIKIELILSLL